MNHDIFISYSSKQKSISDGVCHYLEENGCKCWMAPRDIPVGSEYGDLIEEAIKTSKVVVLVFSQAASISKWVKGEINVAFTEDKPILPFRVDETEIKGGLRVMLNQMHWIDAFPRYADRLPDLLNSVCRFLGRQPQKVSDESERAEAERKAKETAERAKYEKERSERIEAERKAKEAEEWERLEKERLAKEEAERKIKEAAERERIEKEKVEEAKHKAKEEAERARVEKERVKKEETERRAKEIADWERLEKERLEEVEAERKAKEVAERKKQEKEKKAEEAKLKAEQDRKNRELAEPERKVEKAAEYELKENIEIEKTDPKDETIYKRGRVVFRTIWKLILSTVIFGGAVYLIGFLWRFSNFMGLDFDWWGGWETIVLCLILGLSATLYMYFTGIITVNGSD